MGREMKINMENATRKWLKLALTLQNAVHPVYRLKFEDHTTAKKVAHSIINIMDANPTWFRMFIVQRGATLLIIKEDAVTDVTLTGV